MDVTTILNRIAEEVEDHPSPTDLEDVCRHAVASFIRHSDRLPDADEVADIVDETVEAEDMVDPADAVDEESGEVVLTEEQLDNLDDDETVEVEGRKMAVVNGRAMPIRVVSNPMPGRIASRIVASIGASHLALQAEGVEVPTIDSLEHEHEDVIVLCPECASTNCTDVWYDDACVTSICNDCGAEFSRSMVDDADATVEELTTEDIAIVEDGDVSIFGTTWYDPEVCLWQRLTALEM